VKCAAVQLPVLDNDSLKSGRVGIVAATVTHAAMEATFDAHVTQQGEVVSVWSVPRCCKQE
jgi:hypothetical protein